MYRRILFNSANTQHIIHTCVFKMSVYLTLHVHTLLCLCLYLLTPPPLPPAQENKIKCKAMNDYKWHPCSVLIRRTRFTFYAAQLLISEAWEPLWVTDLQTISQNRKKKSIPQVPGCSYLKIKEKNKVLRKQIEERSRYAKETQRTSAELKWTRLSQHQWIFTLSKSIKAASSFQSGSSVLQGSLKHWLQWSCFLPLS